MIDPFSARAGGQVLATDLDGTFIPLDGNQQNRTDLNILASELKDNDVRLVFVTGRHFDSVSNAIETLQLPLPDWIICDVGTSLFRREQSGEFVAITAYDEHLQQIISAMPISSLRQRLALIPGLRLQEDEKQGRYKLSFYAEATQLEALYDQLQRELSKTQAPYSIIHSVDPFNGDGLIDLVPAEVSKAHALRWWASHMQLSQDAIVFAGDSGNDLAALTAGYRAIVVGNADRGVAQRVHNDHQEAGWENRLCIAKGTASSGVLEGCRWFELISHAAPPILRLGATPLTYQRTHFRVWAPKHQTLSVEVAAMGDSPSLTQALIRDEAGYFSGEVLAAAPPRRYSYLLADQVSRPDPASRYQPKGVHGASQIVHPGAFPWTDKAWPGIPKRDLIIYELHIGAFTQAGTFQAAMNQLDALVKLGVTAVEIMPVAQSPGAWNWGYDGVNLFAPRNTYGEPDDFKAFVDACHACGLAVILDVVYNHLGPEGNYLADFGPYFSQEHHTPWGEALNFDGPDAAHVRQYIVANALYWLDEYHLDGLRLDAVHFMHDNEETHILSEIRAAVSEFATQADRAIHLIAEANVYDSDLLRSTSDQTAYDAAWCDCLMHSIYSHASPDLQLSHRTYRGADDLAEVLEHGFLYSIGEHGPVRVSSPEQIEHTRESDLPAVGSLVTALQTHDVVGNHPLGYRLHQLTSKSFQKSAAALTLLYPSIPLIFMGEEHASDSPFPFFADFEDPQLREAVDAGRAREYPQHVWAGALPPSDVKAFLSAKCHQAEGKDADMLTWYHELIQLRKLGLAEGWLCHSRLTTTHDAKSDLFSLRFTHEDGMQILLHARLASLNSQTTHPASVAVDGELLLSSEAVQQDENGHILLQPNQAIVCRGTVE